MGKNHLELRFRHFFHGNAVLPSSDHQVPIPESRQRLADFTVSQPATLLPDQFSPPGWFLGLVNLSHITSPTPASLDLSTFSPFSTQERFFVIGHSQVGLGVKTRPRVGALGAASRVWATNLFDGAVKKGKTNRGSVQTTRCWDKPSLLRNSGSSLLAQRESPEQYLVVPGRHVCTLNFFELRVYVGCEIVLHHDISQ